MATTIANNNASSSTLDKMRINQMVQPRSSVINNNNNKAALSSRKRPRRVQFSHVQVVGIVANREDISKEQADQIWYPSAELEQFKTEARTLCRSLRAEQQQKQGKDDKEPVDIPRGLEPRVCGQRQRRRYLTLCCVLKAQQKSRCSDFIGKVSRKCTQWASDVAHVEGQHDYCDVYQPHLKALLPQVKDIPMYELPISAKRKHPEAATAAAADGNNSEDSDSDNDSVQAAQRNVRARRA